MTKLLALVHFLLALSGCSLGGTSYSHRVAENGSDALYSKTHVKDGVARFECIASNSGACHYTLYPDACDGKTDCELAPLQRFDVARGESRQLTGVTEFRPCVSSDAAALGPDCRPLAIATP